MPPPFFFFFLVVAILRVLVFLIIMKTDTLAVRSRFSSNLMFVIFMWYSDRACFFHFLALCCVCVFFVVGVSTFCGCVRVLTLGLLDAWALFMYALW